jgi:hypothetical protein
MSGNVECPMSKEIKMRCTYCYGPSTNKPSTAFSVDRGLSTVDKPQTIKPWTIDH